MSLALQVLKKVPHLEFRNAGRLTGKTLAGVSTDSRTTAQGELFIALRGEQFDGHAFIRAAIDRGAAAIIAEAGRCPEDLSRVPVMLVEDSTKAYGELARIHRSRFRIPVIAVAGSNGKTTTKEMIVAVLGRTLRVAHTKGNFNNHIGVPATLLGMDRKHDVAVVELGTNHPGELGSLCRLAAPTHGLVTTIGNEHLEFFGSIEGVAEEEGTLYRALAATTGSTAFVHAGDPRVMQQAGPVKRKVRYGFESRKAEVRGRILGVDDRGCARFAFSGGRLKKAVEVRLPVPGRHNAVNALAAVAVGLTFRVPPAQIREALEAFRPPAKRMQAENLGGILVINDAYNANGDSMIASLQVLAETKVGGKRIAVLGDMLELGAQEEEEHARVGRAVASLKIDYLLTYGRRAKRIRDAAGLPAAMHYEQKNMLAEYLAELVAPGDAVLVKGSRGMKMEDVVTFLEERLRPAAKASPAHGAQPSEDPC